MPQLLNYKWILTPHAQNTEQHRMSMNKHNTAMSGYQPFFEVEKDLPQAASSTDHVHFNGSQESKVDFDHILKEK